MRRHVVQEVEVLAETPIGGQPTEDYDVLGSVVGPEPVRPPSWSTIAEMDLDGTTIDRYRS